VHTRQVCHHWATSPAVNITLLKRKMGQTDKMHRRNECSVWRPKWRKTESVSTLGRHYSRTTAWIQSQAHASNCFLNSEFLRGLHSYCRWLWPSVLLMLHNLKSFTCCWMLTLVLPFAIAGEAILRHFMTVVLWFYWTISWGWVPNIGFPSQELRNSCKDLAMSF
jgi:hypothetical protein